MYNKSGLLLFRDFLYAQNKAIKCVVLKHVYSFAIVQIKNLTWSKGVTIMFFLQKTTTEKRN